MKLKLKILQIDNGKIDEIQVLALDFTDYVK